jgi:hypothetical protein
VAPEADAVKLTYRRCPTDRLDYASPMAMEHNPAVEVLPDLGNRAQLCVCCSLNGAD